MYRPITNAVISMYEKMVDVRYQKYWDRETLDNLELAAYFVLEVGCDNHGYENDGSTYHKEWERHAVRFVHVVLHKRHRVYVAVTSDTRLKLRDLVQLKMFKNVGNHDSCYKSSLEDVMSKLYFEVYAEAWDHVEAEHRRIPASSVDVNFHWLFNDIIQFVTVTRERIINTVESMDGYLDRLTDVKPLSVKLEVSE